MSLPAFDPPPLDRKRGQATRNLSRKRAVLGNGQTPYGAGPAAPVAERLSLKASSHLTSTSAPVLRPGIYEFGPGGAAADQ